MPLHFPFEHVQVNSRSDPPVLVRGLHVRFVAKHGLHHRIELFHDFEPAGLGQGEKGQVFFPLLGDVGTKGQEDDPMGFPRQKIVARFDQVVLLRVVEDQVREDHHVEAFRRLVQHVQQRFRVAAPQEALEVSKERFQEARRKQKANR